jgi:hypothetical protein
MTGGWITPCRDVDTLISELVEYSRACHGFTTLVFLHSLVHQQIYTWLPSNILNRSEIGDITRVPHFCGIARCRST